MLKIVNSDGVELMRINDDNTEEIKDAKLKEQFEQARKEQKDGE